MGESHTKTRRHGKVHELPDEIKQEVDRLLIEPDTTYEDIAAYLKSKGHDISKSSIGRYGKDFMNAYREIKIIEDQARTIVANAGDDSMVLEETASKLFSKKIVKLLLTEGIDIKKIPRIVSDFARLQTSSVLRERMKSEFRKKAEKVFEKAEQSMKKLSKEEMLKMLKEEVYGLT